MNGASESAGSPVSASATTDHAATGSPCPSPRRPGVLQPEGVLREPCVAASTTSPAGGGGALKSRRRVHDVPGRQRVAQARHHRDDGLARADRGAYREIEARVRSFNSSIPSRIDRPARTARSASSARASGAPKTAITASPMYFSTTPAVPLDPRAGILEVELVPVADVFRVGAVRARVEPTTSTNRTETSLRSCWPGPWDSSFPHAGQNRAP